jgi:outer membrane protein TolC
MLVPTALAAQGSADSVARPISLDEAVKLAQQTADDRRAAGTTRSNTSVYASLPSSMMLSQLSLSSGASKQNGDRFNPQGELVPFTGAAWQYSSGLRMNVDLLDGGTRFYRLRTAKANVDASEANEVLQQYNVALNVKQQTTRCSPRVNRVCGKGAADQATEQLKTASAKSQALPRRLLRAIIQVATRSSHIPKLTT